MADKEQMPDVVYHYTSMATLLKILARRSLRGTNINYLNDILEVRFYREAMQRRVQAYRHHNRGLSLLATKYIMQENHPFMFLPFVASLSKAGDSLPQWRAYCQAGNGVSIGIRTSSLLEAVVDKSSVPDHLKATLGSPDVRFEKITYPDEQDFEHIDQTLRSVGSMVSNRRHWKASAPHVEMKHIVNLFVNMVASTIKHPSFRAEEEYRLLTNGFVQPELIDYHASSTTLKPYLNFVLPDPVVNSDRVFVDSFISKVFIGPSVHPDLTEQAVRGLFISRRLEVDVQMSNVPYRDLF